MFAGIKRALFISRASAPFRYNYGHLGDAAQVHLKLQAAGCPANELVDLYIAAGCSSTEFSHFLYHLHQWWIDEDEVGLGSLREWAQQPNVQAADRQGLIALLDKFWINRKQGDSEGSFASTEHLEPKWQQDIREHARDAVQQDKARGFKPRQGEGFGEPSTLEQMGMGSWPEEKPKNVVPNEVRPVLTFDTSVEVCCGWCERRFLLGEVKTWRHGNTYLCPHCNRVCNGW